MQHSLFLLISILILIRFKSSAHAISASSSKTLSTLTDDNCCPDKPTVPVKKTFGFPRILSISSKCKIPINVGVCKDNIDRYYFDVNTKTCKSGCDNNQSTFSRNTEEKNNQFSTRETCEQQCVPSSTKSIVNDSLSMIANVSEQAFETKHLGSAVDGEAPDGSDVRLLLSLAQGSMAHFSLDPGKTSRAVQHRTVSEIWFFVTGEGEMWRKQGDREAFAMVQSGTCITIPAGTQFQFRSLGKTPLTAVAITMPPWPGDSEPMFPSGIWNASLVSTSIKPTSTASILMLHQWLLFIFLVSYTTFLS